MLHERWYRTHLSLAGRDVVVPRDDTAALNALGVRRFERGFLKRLAALHAKKLDAPFAELLELPPSLPEKVEQVVAVLRKALSLTEPLRHLGKREDPLPRPKDATFTVVESHGAHANGAGTMTLVSDWALELFAPIRLRVSVDAADEEGTQTSWGIHVRAVTGTMLEPLLDAFREQGLWFHVEVSSLD